MMSLDLHIDVYICFLMLRRPPRSTRTDTLFPYTTLFQSNVDGKPGVQTFLVRVANVARTAVDSSARRYGLDFTLMPTTSESQCTFSATLEIEHPGGYEYRSEERRVGKECVSTCRSRCRPYH